MNDLLSPGNLGEIIRVLDLLGVFGSAVLGGAIARSERLDLFGFLVVGIISGLGGGIIRDTLLQNGPPVALTDVAYLPTAIGGALVAFIANFSHDGWNRLFTVADALVLGVWAIVGAQKTIGIGLGWLPAILMGTITAVGGGACRDLILRRVPAVFGGNALYATVAVVVAAIMVVSSYFDVPTVGIVGGILFGALFRLLAFWRGWGLPNGLEWQPHSKIAKVMRSTWSSTTQVGANWRPSRSGSSKKTQLRPAESGRGVQKWKRRRPDIHS